ncbi:transglycosylase domain-containing protein [Nocardioides ferulae]|uniref:transglycosylase domain-containing protein n=1 Tax=Nocardioides ferulae TaxID=2340821 RepID=UPI000EB47A07|nr:transglycosylase domain-containing protein [Nocardioides ferulae]
MSGKRRADGPSVKASSPQGRPAKPGRGGKPPRSRKQKALRVLMWFGIVGLVGALLAAAGFVYLYQTIEVPDPNEDFQTQTTFVYYADGKTELGSFATQNRVSIDLDEMPQTLQDAVVAAENRSFWTDSGIDPRGILRAAFNNAQGGTTQGASTITQQYVKILYLTQERTWERKAKEAILSLKIHRQQTKSQILEGYLNTIYFGRGAYGVEAAAHAYFDKPAAKLSLRESAVLAAVLNNPTRFDPDNGKDARLELRDRYEWILGGMAEMDTISPEQAEKAQRRLPKFPEIAAESRYGGQKGHMLTMVRKELVRLGFSEDEIDGGGLRVTTTFDPKVMAAAQEAAIEQRPEGFGDKELHTAVASVEPGTGAVRGFYAGQDYLDSQINWAVSGGQGGSILKPFALVAAIRDGFSLKDTFYGNSPIELPDGTDIENQGNTPYGEAIDMIAATENSVNTAFIDMTMSMENGPEKIIQAATDMGLPPEEPRFKKAPGFPNRTPGLEPVLGVALGSATVSPINMANAYGTLAAEGRAAEAYIIEKVVDTQSGETEYVHRDTSEQTVDADIAADVTYAMQQVVNTGSGTAALSLGREAAGKTGTSTNGPGDVVSAWFTGFTPQLSTSVVYVRGDGVGKLDDWLPSYFGGAYPAETWTAAMAKALEGLPEEEFPEPVFVDGEAPEAGHEPYTPPPSPTKKPSPTKEPTQEPTKTPSQPPSSSPPPTTESPSQSPTQSPTDDGPTFFPSPTGTSSPTQSGSGRPRQAAGGR